MNDGSLGCNVIHLLLLTTELSVAALGFLAKVEPLMELMKISIKVILKGNSTGCSRETNLSGPFYDSSGL